MACASISMIKTLPLRAVSRSIATPHARCCLSTSNLNFAKKSSDKTDTKTKSKTSKVTKKTASAPIVETANPIPSTYIPQDQNTYNEYAKDYKCPEYYKHSDVSFYDIENEMEKLRCEQPTAL